MPQVAIIMPQLGESIAEATIVDIKVKPGDDVVDDQEIIDVETNKAVMGVTTPCKGKIEEGAACQTTGICSQAATGAAKEAAFTRNARSGAGLRAGSSGF